VDATRLSPGHIITRPHQKPPLARKCQAKIVLFSSSQQNSNVVIIQGAQATFHMHSLDVPCHISKLIRLLNADGTSAKERPRALASRNNGNVPALVELVLQVPICMQTFSDCRALGRFVLRRAGESIAAGRIEQVIEEYISK